MTELSEEELERLERDLRSAKDFIGERVKALCPDDCLPTLGQERLARDYTALAIACIQGAQAISALTRARDEARAQALEEAARLVEEHRRDGPETVAAIGLKQKLAAALRSLAEEQP